jgi:hypothetical protein
MDNHIHRQRLSDIMNWLKGKLHGKKSGHLWGKRFFSKIIADVGQFLNVFAYIDKNPKEAKMVVQSEDWEYGGLYHHLHGRKDVVDIPRSAMPELFFPGAVVEWTW